MDRVGAAKPSSLLHPGLRGVGGDGNTPKSKLSSPTSYGSYESSCGELHQPCMVEQYPKPIGSNASSIPIALYVTHVEHAQPLQFDIKPICEPISFIFYSSRELGIEPNDISIDASDDSSSAVTTTQLPSIETIKGRKGEGSYVHRNSKLKRSSPYALLENARQEIHLSLPNTTEKVLHRHTPSDQSYDSEIYSSDKPYSERASQEEDLNNLPPPPLIMNRPINIIVWNIREASNEGAIRNLRDIINNYNPIVLALLETRQEDHSSLRDTL